MPAPEAPKKDTPLTQKEPSEKVQPPKSAADPPSFALPPAAQKTGANLTGLLSRFLHMENDTALLLPLLLLLGREGADDALLLALLYLMG